MLGCFGLGFEVGEVFGEGLLEDGEFGGFGVAAGGGAEEGGEAIRGGWGGDEDVLGEGAGGLEELDVVHESEGLQGGVAAFALEAIAFAIGGVEGSHVRGRGGAFPEGVEAAAVEGFAMVLDVVFGVAAAEGDGFPDVFGLIGADAFAAHGGGEEAGEEEGLIANDFGVEAEAGAAGEELVFGVSLEVFGGELSALAIGVGGDDAGDEFFHVPAVFAEGDSEPVEEFGMGGRGALGAEVVAGFDEAGAEELLPEAVDGDAGGEGVVGAYQPLGEVEAGGLFFVGKRGEESGGVAVDGGGGFVIEAAVHDEAGAGFGQIRHDEGGGDGVFEGFLFGFEGEFLSADAFDDFAGALVFVFEPPVFEAGGVGCRPFGGFFTAHEGLEIAGEFGDAFALVGFDPGLQGPLGVFGGIDAGAHGEVVPVDGAVELGEGEAGDFGAGFEAEFGGVDFEFGPFAEGGEGADFDAFGGADLAEGDGTFFTPDGAVVPAGGVELEHDSGGGIFFVEVALDAEFAVGWDGEVAALGEEVLGDALGSAFEGFFAAEDGAGFLGDEFGGGAGGLEI